MAERYEVDAEKTVWTKTLWKYVSQEWDFRYYEMNDDSEDTDDDDILQVIDIFNASRAAHELIELWAKRRKIFRGVKCSSNVKEAVINGDTIEEEEEKEEEENVETPENEQPCQNWKGLNRESDSHQPERQRASCYSPRRGRTTI